MGFVNVGRPTWPSNLSTEANKRFAGNDIDVDADLLAVPELILKRCLRAVPPHHAIFLGL